VKGQAFDSWRSVGIAMQAARIHATRGVDELIVLDISATPEKRGPNLNIVGELTSDCYIPVTIGGGVRSIEDVRDLLNAGADKVAICTTAFEHPEVVQECATKYGSQAIVVSIDVKNGFVHTHCGKTDQIMTPVWAAKKFEKLGAGEIMLTSIGRDGTMQGYDLDLIKSVSDAVSIPVIASGGCRDYDDMYDAFKAGADACAAGALFAFTDATPRGAAEYLNKRGVVCRM
jgi:cyclase